MIEFTVKHQVLTRYIPHPFQYEKRTPSDYDYYEAVAPTGVVLWGGEGDEGQAKAQQLVDGYNLTLFRGQLESAENERKQQDILVAELTQKVIDLQSEIQKQNLDYYNLSVSKDKRISELEETRERMAEHVAGFAESDKAKGERIEKLTSAIQEALPSLSNITGFSNPEFAGRKVFELLYKALNS